MSPCTCVNTASGTAREGRYGLHTGNIFRFTCHHQITVVRRGPIYPPRAVASLMHSCTYSSHSCFRNLLRVDTALGMGHRREHPVRAAQQASQTTGFGSRPSGCSAHGLGWVTGHFGISVSSSVSADRIKNTYADRDTHMDTNVHQGHRQRKIQWT